VVEGETVDFVFVIEAGWAIRFRMMDDGRRQILNFMLPGDCFDLMSLNKAHSDHSISAATEVTLRRVKSDDFLRIIAKSPQLATSFWWAAIQEEVVHISRTLSRLKSEGLIKTGNEGIQILNREKLAEISDFDSRYLRLEKLKI